MVGKINIAGITKVFQSNEHTVRAIENISAEISAGSFVSFLGASGCGKTTLLRLISGLETPTGGEIHVDDVKVTGASADIGFVFQQPKLFPWMTVYENIAFGLKARKVYSNEKESINEFIEMIGLQDFKKAFPHQLSGGMQQRAALARALINKPKALMLDEPLGALDALTRMKMQNEILNIWRNHKITMVMVTHDVEEAVFLSEKIMVMTRKEANIQATINVELPYPRERESKEFLDYKSNIYKFLSEDTSVLCH